MVRNIFSSILAIFPKAVAEEFALEQNATIRKDRP
jgi:hypothetical protein